MKDFKQYNSTVKSVLIACEQSALGYHLSEGDLRALKEAINDLQSLYDTRSIKTMSVTTEHELALEQVLERIQLEVGLTKDINNKRWTPVYKEGYIDGLNRVIQLLEEL